MTLDHLWIKGLKFREDIEDLREDEKMGKNRNLGLDLSRVIAMFFVVGLHVTDGFFSQMPGKETAAVFTADFILAIAGKSFMGVFFMTSGAFVLGSASTANYRAFYRKTWKRLGLPTVVFSLLHLLINPLWAQLYYETGPGSWPALLGDSFLKMLRGEASVHLWFMFTLIGLYMLAPVLVKAKELFGEKGFTAAAVILFFWSMISSQSETYAIRWSTGHIMAYLGLFMMGYVLYSRIRDRESNGRAVLFLLGAALVMIAMYFGRMFLSGSDAGKVVFSNGEPYNPLPQIAGILLFLGFASLKISFDPGTLAGLTYWIYLPHVLVLNWIIFYGAEKNLHLFENASGPVPALLVLLMYTLFTYALCAGVSHLILRFLEGRKASRNR